MAILSNKYIDMNLLDRYKDKFMSIWETDKQLIDMNLSDRYIDRFISSREIDKNESICVHEYLYT